MNETREHWNERYRSSNTPWETGHADSELKRVVADKKIVATSALELGCGMGANAVWMASRGFDVTAVDISEVALATAAERATQAGVQVRWLHADVRALPPTLGTFRFIFDRGCYHVVRRDGGTADYLRVLRQVCTTGTAALILTGNAREPRSPGPPVVTEQELRDEIGSVLKIVDLREFRFDPSPADEDPHLGFSCFAIYDVG